MVPLVWRLRDGLLRLSWSLALSGALFYRCVCVCLGLGKLSALTPSNSAPKAGRGAGPGCNRSSFSLLLPGPPPSTWGQQPQRSWVSCELMFGLQSLSLCLMGPSGLSALSVHLGGKRRCLGQAILLTSFSTVCKAPDQTTQMVLNGHEEPLDSGLLSCLLS